MPYYRMTWETYVEADDEDSIDDRHVREAFDPMDCDAQEVTEAEALDKAPWLAPLSNE